MASETTYDAVVDEMFGIINDAWKADSTAVAGYIPEIRWKGAPKADPAPMDKYWARVSSQLVTDAQSSLSSFNGTKRYRATGLLYFQLFCPRTLPDRESVGRKLAMLIHSAFRKPSISGAIEFRNNVIRELPESEDYYPINVVVNFEFDSVQ
jgi:hypothetical protein